MGRYLSWLANTALFVLCCFLVANTANTVLASLLAPEPQVTAPAARAASATQRSWADREVILTRNLFNASLLTPVGQEELSSEEELEATKLPLKLVGTAAHADPERSWAAVEDLQARKTLIVRPEDEVVQGARVLRIERRRVVLLENGQPRALGLDEEEDEGTKVARPNRRPRRALANRARSNRDIANRVREIARNRFEVPREDIQEALQNPASIFSQVQFQPKYEDGEMLGLQVNSVRPGSVFEELGIASGDLILEVNGIPIDSTEASTKVLTEFAKGQVTVGIEGPDGDFREVEIQGSGEE